MKEQEKTEKKKSRLVSIPLHAVKHTGRKAKERLREHRHSSPHRSFRLTNRSEVPRYKKLPAWWRLTAQTARLLKGEWKKIALLIAAFAPLSWLVSGIYAQDFGNVKLALDILGEEAVSGVEEAFVLFTGFFTAQTSGVAQDSLVVLNLLGLLFWLSFVWVARYAYARKKTTVREALYTSGAAFIPFLLLLVLLVVQLLPMLLAGLILNSMAGTGFTQTAIETALFGLLAVLLTMLSLYFVISTIVALQIVALPGMYPWRALRNARKLVAGKRFSVLRKFVMLALMILVAWVILFIPILLLDNKICSEGEACWSTLTILPLTYYILVGLTLAFVSTFTYIMYRALLQEGDALV